jgi:hypothetical protein
MPQPAILVLDDYRVLNARPIDHALIFLIERLPPQMMAFCPRPSAAICVHPRPVIPIVNRSWPWQVYRTTCRGFLFASPPPPSQITTSITTCGDACSPHQRVSSDHERNVGNNGEIHPQEEHTRGAVWLNQTHQRKGSTSLNATKFASRDTWRPTGPTSLSK